MITIPMRTVPGMNVREVWQARSRRVKRERSVVGWVLSVQKKPEIPCQVRLTRIAPSAGVDDDNLSGSLKAIRDQVAEWLGVDDKHRDIVRYVYAQKRGPWAVGIEFLPPEVRS